MAKERNKSVKNPKIKESVSWASLNIKLRMNTAVPVMMKAAQIRKKPRLNEKGHAMKGVFDVNDQLGVVKKWWQGLIKKAWNRLPKNRKRVISELPVEDVARLFVDMKVF